MTARPSATALGLLTLLGGCATSPLDEFERVLAAQDSATAALGQWCRMHGIAELPAIRAERLGGTPEASGEVRALLGVAADEALAYRHVRLVCGSAVLSEADNWYVPARLTPEMNRLLAQTDTPFGSVAAPLGFHRERLAEQRGGAPGCPPGTILRHRALLRLPDGVPLSLVTECYTDANLVN